MSAQDRWPEDMAQFVFETDEVIPVSDLADSFKALDNFFARETGSGARLAVAEIRKGSIVALLAPFVPLLGPTMSFVSTTVEVADFIKRLRDGLNAFAGIEPVAGGSPPELDQQIAGEIAALVKPLAGRSGSRLGIAHIRYQSRTAERSVEFEAAYSSSEIDRIAVNAARGVEAVPEVDDIDKQSDQPSLLHKVVLTLQQTNTSPAKAKGKTGDRGVIQSVTSKPLAVYFANTVNDLKAKMVGRSSNPFRKPFTVDVVVAYENGEPKSYTVIDVHRATRQPRKSRPKDLLSKLG